MTPDERCRVCGMPTELDHRGWCRHAVGDPEPDDQLADANEYGWAEDRLIAQITGEPRDVR